MGKSVKYIVALLFLFVPNTGKSGTSIMPLGHYEISLLYRDLTHGGGAERDANKINQSTIGYKSRSEVLMVRTGLSYQSEIQFTVGRQRLSLDDGILDQTSDGTFLVFGFNEAFKITNKVSAYYLLQYSGPAGLTKPISKDENIRMPAYEFSSGIASSPTASKEFSFGVDFSRTRFISDISDKNRFQVSTHYLGFNPIFVSMLINYQDTLGGNTLNSEQAIIDYFSHSRFPNIEEDSSSITLLINYLIDQIGVGTSYSEKLIEFSSNSQGVRFWDVFISYRR